MSDALPANSDVVLPALRQDLSLVIDGPAQASTPQETEAFIHGKPVTYDEGLAKAKALIEASAAPAIVGLNGLTMEALREAIPLAESQRMRLLPLPLPDPIAGSQTVTQTATLGHALAADLQVKRPPTATDNVADRMDTYITSRVPNTLFMPVDELDAVLRLRSNVRELGAKVFTQATALPVKRIVVLLPHACDLRVVSQWHRLAVELQQEIRIAVLTLPSPDAGNIRGANEAITWQTGLSCTTGGIDFGDGSPRPCAGAATLLERGAIDLVIDTGLRALPEVLATRAAHRIRIGPERNVKADVSFVTPGLALGLAAQVMRFDGVLLWLCEDVPTARPDPVVKLFQLLVEDDLFSA